MDVIKHFKYPIQVERQTETIRVTAGAIGDVNKKRLERRLLQRWVQLAQLRLSPVFSGICVTRSIFYLYVL